MDCTYKTNKFGMPLLDIIGVSSFNTSFYSCFAFLSKEEETDYCWALNRFKKILGGNEPIVIVSDRELAPMNAIKVIFPRTANLLCFWHIETNIIAKCKGHFEKAEDWTTFLEQWGEIVESDSISLFNELWEGFEFSYKEKPIVVNYIKSTWLPFKEHFVKAWADVYLHFGNRVTSRAEGAHPVLKKYLQVSTSNLKVTTERICLAVENNHHEIKTRLAREKIITPHNICVPFFKEIFHCVSVFAIEKLFQQYKYALVDSPLSACKGHFYSSMGLPCAHMMRGMKDRVLLISDIHPQWRIDKRSIEDGDAETTNGKDKLHDLFEELEHNYQQWPIAQQEITQKQLSQIINLSAPIVFDPIVHPHRGRPSKSKTKKTSSSTRRDPSAFEIVDKSRKCSTCKEVGHNSRTCPRGVRGDNANFSSLVSNPVEGSL